MRIHRTGTQWVAILSLVLLLLLPPVQAFLHQVWTRGLSLYDSLAYEDRFTGYGCGRVRCTPIIRRVKKHPLLPGPVFKTVAPYAPPGPRGQPAP